MINFYTFTTKHIAFAWGNLFIRIYKSRTFWESIFLVDLTFPFIFLKFFMTIITFNISWNEDLLFLKKLNANFIL